MQTDEKVESATEEMVSTVTATVDQQIKREYRDMAREAQYQTQLLTQQGKCKFVLLTKLHKFVAALSIGMANLRWSIQMDFVDVPFKMDHSFLNTIEMLHFRLSKLLATKPVAVCMAPV